MCFSISRFSSTTSLIAFLTTHMHLHLMLPRQLGLWKYGPEYSLTVKNSLTDLKVGTGAFVEPILLGLMCLAGGKIVMTR